jgi:hypothetical protein
MAPACKLCKDQPQQKRKDRENSFRGYCTECERTIAREYARKRRQDNPELVAKKAKEYTLLRQYNMTFDDYLAMQEEQNYKCAICGKVAEDSPMGVLCVDHCHSSGDVRGLLCSHCNTAIGFFNDDEDLLLRARDYIMKFKYSSEVT